MPHVSKRKLEKKVLSKIFKEFVQILEKAQRKGKFTPILHELFTETEKIMLAKRLAIILMLSGHIPQHRIAEALIVSPTTVTKISLEIEIGKYASLISISKKAKLDLERIVWSLLTAEGIMPPMVGGKYWKKYRAKNNL